MFVDVGVGWVGLVEGWGSVYGNIIVRIGVLCCYVLLFL